ncbi:hypothetical protein [Trebonia sp.]|uniref:hypothetical protein n=1 Tax=Trebonia sp. TaxID=2767075 RepID=UPI00262D513A|nr:hypothetical protein [Trebonia sp.]
MELARDLAGIFERPRVLTDGARAAGDPIAVLVGLLWRRALVASWADALKMSRSVLPRRQPPPNQPTWSSRYVSPVRSWRHGGCRRRSR